MTNRKNHNSIIFLTTLSVYLGLVLVGGVTPSVFAQAATNQHFDIKNEFEVKDDLDKNPDDNDSSQPDFPILFAELLAQIKLEAANGNIQLPLPDQFYIGDGFASGFGSGDTTLADKKLDKILWNAISEKYTPVLYQLGDVQKDGYKSGGFSLNADQTNWSIEISFGKNRAAQFAINFNRKNKLKAARIKEISLKRIYENTIALSKNRSVFISTQLPRAFIDELLADKTAR